MRLGDETGSDFVTFSFFLSSEEEGEEDEDEGVDATLFLLSVEVVA